MQRFKILVPAPIPVPRGAKWAADVAAPVFNALSAIGSKDSVLAVAGARSLRALWRVLESQGRRRAIRELSAMAERSATNDPERAKRLRECAAFLAFEEKNAAGQPPIAVRKTPEDRAREAAEVRAWAGQFKNTDPSFAAELYAAADRHETVQA